MTVKVTLARMEQLVKILSLISTAIARQALWESSVRLMLMTVQFCLVVMVALVLTEWMDSPVLANQATQEVCVK